MTAPSKGDPTMSANSESSIKQAANSGTPPPLMPGRVAPEPGLIGSQRDLIPIPLLIGIFAVVIALTVFLLADNWKTDMTRYLSRKAQQRGDWVASVKHLNTLMKAGADRGDNQVANSPTYLSEVGLSYGYMGKYKEALDYYQRAQANKTNVAPDEQGNARTAVDFQGKIGIMQFKMGNLEAAQKSLLAAIEVNKLDPEANFALGEIAMKQGNYTKAADYFKVVAANPSYEQPVKKYYAEIEQKLFANIK